MVEPRRRRTPASLLPLPRAAVHKAQARHGRAARLAIPQATLRRAATEDATAAVQGRAEEAADAGRSPGDPPPAGAG